MLFMSPDEARAHHDNQIAHAEERRNRIHRLFHEMEKDDLATMYDLLSSIVNSGDLSLTSYYQGVAATTLQLKHGACVCGRDHANELLEYEVDSTGHTVPPTQRQSGEDAPDPSSILNEVDAAVAPDPDAVEAAYEGHVLAKYKKFNVEPVFPEKLTGSLRCKSCGEIFVDLEARAKFVGCPGCNIASPY